MNQRTFVGPLALALVGSAQANLLVNGSFELGPNPDYYPGTGGDTTVTGWTGLATGYEWFVPSTVYGGIYGSASDQLACVDLANLTYSNGGIGQTFATTAGAQYMLTFDMTTSTYAGRSGYGAMSASVDSGFSTTSSAYSVTNNQLPFVWTSYSLLFTAQASTSTLRLECFQDANLNFAVVDNARIEAVPEPASVVALASGALLLLRRRSR